jgi:CRP-like cAMP-binding protein
MRISRHLFRKTLEGFPEAAQRLRDHMADRAQETAEEISRVRATLGPEREQAEEGGPYRYGVSSDGAGGTLIPTTFEL